MKFSVFPGVTSFHFFPVAISVNDQQGENNQAADSQNGDAGLVTPHIAHKIGNILAHFPTYTISVESETGCEAPVASLPEFRGGGHPACRRAEASRPADKTLEPTNRAGTFQNRTHLPSFYPGGGTPALHGRRDVCRYQASGAAFPKVDQIVPMQIGTAM
ncbi:MAG: hypothetical protein ABSA45_09695 [Verrucomicrobiota bacterium]